MTQQDGQHENEQLPASPATDVSLPQADLPPQPAPRKPLLSPWLSAFLRVLLFYVVIIVASGAVSWGLSYRIHPIDFENHMLRVQLITRSASAVVALLVTWLFARVERRPFGTFGLPGRQAFRRDFWIGIALGIAALSTVIALLAATSVLRLAPTRAPFSEALTYGVGWAVVFMAVAIAEEEMMRGYAFATLAARGSFWLPALITSLVFTLAHAGNSGETALGLATVFAFGVFACWTFRRTGSLWLAVGFHASWDWAQSFLFGVADSGFIAPGTLLRSTVSGPAWLSGGTAGPEGSVFIAPAFALSALLLARLYPRRSVSI
jgi:membrane protease YdiL (CAAX protease family)